MKIIYTLQWSENERSDLQTSNMNYFYYHQEKSRLNLVLTRTQLGS